MKKWFFWLALWFISTACQSHPPAPTEHAAGRLENPSQERSLSPVVVAFGDSLTAGSGVPRDQNYPAQLQVLLDRAGYSYHVVNAGIGGDTTAQGLSRLQNVIDQDPHLVILELGGNDGLRGVPIVSIRQNLDTMIRRLKAARIPVVLAGMRIPPNYGPAYAEQFHQTYWELAKKHDLGLIPFLLEDVAGRPELNLEDGIHPSAEGYSIVARTVFEAIEPSLR